MLRYLTICVGLLMSGFAATPASAVGEFSSGNWRGGAFYNGGNFSHCAMFAPYVTGWKLLFSINREGYVDLGLEHADLNLTVGNTADFRMQIDSSPVITRTFKVLDRTLIATTFTGSVDWFQRLRKGRNLRIWIGDSTESFSLQGTNNALARARHS
jgi:hypothetical protein